MKLKKKLHVNIKFTTNYLMTNGKQYIFVTISQIKYISIAFNCETRLVFFFLNIAIDVHRSRVRLDITKLCRKKIHHKIYVINLQFSAEIICTANKWNICELIFVSLSIG